MWKSVRTRSDDLHCLEGIAMPKWVYSFGGGKAEGEQGMKNLLGGNGAYLAEMSNL